MGDFFVRRPIVAMVIAIFMVIVGVVSLGGLPTEQYPNITPPIVEVRATYTGANAVSVEQSVATPLEQQINGVDNMIYMKSINANDGTMTIQVSFDVGTDPDMNTVFTQNRVAAATAKLPEEVKRLGVTTEKSMPNILMLISLTAEDPRFDQQFLGNYSLINIKDILARIKGIGRVNVLGASDYSMRIWIKPDRLAHLGITVCPRSWMPSGPRAWWFRAASSAPSRPRRAPSSPIRSACPTACRMPRNSAKSSSGRPRTVPRSRSNTSPGWNWGWRPTTPLRA
jgi:HAE1 family hydrophobic/amphiphilic exporter-1